MKSTIGFKNVFFKLCMFAGLAIMSANGQTDIAQGKTATSSSNENATNVASKAVDGNLTTRWASVSGSDPQWLKIDLGTTMVITRVILRWESASGKNYTVDVSPDGSTGWVTLATKTNMAAGARVDDITVSGSGRYIRMHGTARTGTYGYSLFAFEVNGTVPPPVIVNPPVDVITLEGRPAAFDVTVTSAPTPVFVWQKNGVDIAGANAASYTLDPVTSADNGAKFRVRITNGGGTVTSAEAKLIVVATKFTYPQSSSGDINGVTLQSQYGILTSGSRSTLKVKGIGGDQNAGEMSGMIVEAAAGNSNTGRIYGAQISSTDGLVESNADVTGLSVFASKHSGGASARPAIGLAVSVSDPDHDGGYAAVFLGGKVGVGNPHPSEMLDVGGNANVSGSLTAATIITNKWKIPVPDYVFEKGYRLQSLEEVDKFVQKHKHLPEIPSAKEMNKEGLDLAEMNLRLLKKVEEMTLHMISMDKNLKEQARKNEGMESQLKALKDSNENSRGR